MRILQNPLLPQRLHHPPEVEVQVLDHPVIPRQLPRRLLPNRLHQRHILPEFDIPRAQPGPVIRRSHRRIVRRLHRTHRKKRLGVPRLLCRSLRRHLLPNILDQQIRQRIRLIPRQPVMKRVLPLATMHPAVVLRIVVLVPHPLIEPAPLLRIGNEVRRPALALMKPAQMPLPEIRRAVPGLFQRLRNRRLTLRQRILMPHHAMVRIPPRQH